MIPTVPTWPSTFITEPIFDFSWIFIFLNLFIAIEGNRKKLNQAMVLLGFFLRITTFTLTLTLTQIVDGFQSRMLMNNGLALTPQMGFDPLHFFFFLVLLFPWLTSYLPLMIALWSDGTAGIIFSVTSMKLSSNKPVITDSTTEKTKLMHDWLIDYNDNNLCFSAADAMVSTGLSAIGYKYINIGKNNIETVLVLLLCFFTSLFSNYCVLFLSVFIDDCWGELKRDSQVK